MMWTRFVSVSVLAAVIATIGAGADVSAYGYANDFLVSRSAVVPRRPHFLSLAPRLVPLVSLYQPPV